MTADFNFYINRQGARGRQGEQGKQGFSPVITVNTDTAQEYKLNIETENDLIVTPNLKGNPLSVIPGAGKYVLFDEANNTIYNSAKPSELVDIEMLASTSDAGIIRIADDSDITEKATDAAVTPKQLADAINEVENTIPTDTVTHTELTTAINGVVSQIPGMADLTTAGIIKPDGVTTTVAADGTLTAIQSAPANMVTLDTAQTISANKSTTGSISFAPTVIGAGDKNINISQTGINLSSGLAGTSWNVTTDNGDLKFAVSGYGTQANGFTFTNNFTTIRLGNNITIGDNIVLTSASVDGTTITYDNITGKISAAAAGDVTKAGNNDFTGNNTFTNIQANAANGYSFSTNKNLVTFPNTSCIFRYDQDSLGVRRDGWSETVETPEGSTTIDHPATYAKLIDSDSVDGTTITYNSSTGKISAAGSAPSNMVTTDTQQTISGIKTWTGQQFINGGVEFGYTYTNRSRGAFSFGSGSSNQPNAVISPNGYIDLTGYGNAKTNNIRLDYYTANALTIRRQVASGTIDNGVFNVWSGNTAAASSTRFKVDNTGVTVNDSKVLTESTGVKSSDIRNIVKLTQAEYDALTTKDANTQYIITGKTGVDNAFADFSNITDEAKIAIAHNSTPSGTSINLTLGASGTTYTAPADGYFQCYIGGQSGYKWLRLMTSGNYLQEAGFTTSNNIGFTVPVQKGQTLNVKYTGTVTASGLTFIYAQGSESEAS